MTKEKITDVGHKSKALKMMCADSREIDACVAQRRPTGKEMHIKCVKCNI